MSILSKLAVKVAEKAAGDEAERAAARAVARRAEGSAARRVAPVTAPTKSLAVKPKAKVPAAPRTVRPAERRLDPRLEPRKKEAPKIESMTVGLSERRSPRPKALSVFDLEGRPFVTSMSDMSAAGDDIVSIGDVPLAAPVRRQGGQDYMFDSPDAVWAADKGPARDILDFSRRLKTATGQDPLYLPWAMGPTAVDFAHMPREVMLQYAASNMGKRGRTKLTREIQSLVPDFREMGDPASTAAFSGATGKARGELNRLLDQYRDDGGLGMGAARIASTDLDQVGLPLTSLRNVGVVDTASDLVPSGHSSYSTGIPGAGVGRLQENLGALQLLPDMMEAYGLSDPFGFPVGVVKGVASPLRSMQLGVKGGVITDKVLRAIQDRAAQAGTP